jgi:hypothetical protein
MEQPAHIYRNTSIQPEEDSSVADRMIRLQEQFDETGMRRSVDAVIVCHVSMASAGRGKGKRTNVQRVGRNDRDCWSDGLTGYAAI